MDVWKGIHDDEALIGDDQISLIVGVSFRVAGELDRRAGLTASAAFGGISVGNFVSSSGSWLMIVTAAGTIEAATL